jgi:hypothetical protein
MGTPLGTNQNKGALFYKPTQVTHGRLSRYTGKFLIVCICDARVA